MIFPQDQSDDSLSVEVPEFVVRVARVKPNNDPTKPPTWGPFIIEPRLKFTGAFAGSKIAHMSYASCSLAVGAPVTDDKTYIENVDVLSQGDRVIVCSGKVPLWAGYQADGEISIDTKAETLDFHHTGPEWVWGNESARVVYKTFPGQLRRIASEDDAYLVSLASHISAFSTLFYDADRPAIINPGGRANMSTQDCNLNAGGRWGRCFEEADRLGKTGAPIAEFWTIRQLVNTALLSLNDLQFTGISFDDLSILPDDRVPEMNLTGLDLWSILARVCGTQYSFFVTPIPSSPTSFDGFKIVFYQVGVGPDANLWLNDLNTSMADAKKSILRVQASKSIANTINRVVVYGKAIRHIKLIYRGDQTPSQPEIKMAIGLQHGWGKNEGNLADYADGDAVEIATIEKAGATISGQWSDRYVRTGNEYTMYSHVFRTFLWNEAGDLQAGNATRGVPIYGKSSPLDWYSPVLKTIADGDGFVTDGAGVYCRKRRKLLDTAYVEPSAPGQAWLRVKPTVFIGAVPESVDSADLNDNEIDWIQLQDGVEFLRDRAGITFTHENLAKWFPFDRHSPNDTTAYPAGLFDMRSFATLLYTGKLRILIEASIECDTSFTAIAERRSTSPSAFINTAHVDHKNQFYKTLVYNDGITSPIELPAMTLDQSADAQALAEQIRDACDYQTVHASVLISATWKIPAIGSILNQTKGRVVDLSAGGRGGQIVAYTIDPDTLTTELLTESLAKQLRAETKMRRNPPKDQRRPW